ncbi:YbeU/YbeR family protein [Marinospirillum perlucidum]|uniref:YbeU/YbeR family protein n=1 Tax=Marinospirillum perlucidum TaxID=1982602 RepID=UPI0013900F93|nr:YbeU/YbeR family protein [Marinospirillum perlucidum]
MSVSLSIWLRPLTLLSQDDRENAEILAELRLSHLADAYAYLYQAWQEKTADKLLTSIQVIQALDRLHWLDADESQAWLGLFARRLQQTFPQAAALLEELESKNYPQVRLQKLQAADWTRWHEELDIPWIACPDRVTLPPELQVRSTPIGYALAVRSSSFVIYRQPLKDPESLRERFWPDVKSTLNTYWQVHTANDCLQLIFWLGGQGQRYAWQLDYQWLRTAEEEDKSNWYRELPEGFEGYAQLLEEKVATGGDELDVAAWDWVRMADLALAGYLAGYLSATQWRSFALVALWLLRSRYSSWEALADSYLLGYQLWQTQTDFSLSPELEVTWQQLLTLPFSPLKQLDWQALSLDHPDFRDALSFYSQQLDDPLMLGSLLASLRDDVSLLTGLALDDLPSSRKNEARDYLFAGLDIHPDEQLTATLARFWQPGRVHHYDQLALNSRVGKQPLLPDNLAAVEAVWETWREQAPQLAQLVAHPAGIIMAEKYAFYLVKALETDHYPLEEIQQLALALKDYLSWHYSSALDLLQAWQAWDRVLGQDSEERPLSNELNWHLQDAGSLFRFLPWKRPPARLVEPGKPVSEADLATLNLVGPLTGLHWSWPEKLPQHPRQELKNLLQDTHLFQDAGDLKDYLNHLLVAGDRQEYMIVFSPFTLNSQRLEHEIEAQQQEGRDDEQEGYYQRLLRVRDNVLGVNDVDLTAWDMAQLVDLAVAGYQLDWLSDAELREWLGKARSLITREYTGWSDFAQALLAGYNFFMHETEKREELLEVFSQRLLSLLIAVPAQAGLWYTLAWPGDRQPAWNHSAASLTGNQRLH